MQENKRIKATYEAPKVEVYEVLVEHGFSASGIVSGSMIESPGIVQPEIDW